MQNIKRQNENISLVFDTAKIRHSYVSYLEITTKRQNHNNFCLSVLRQQSLIIFNDTWIDKRKRGDGKNQPLGVSRCRKNVLLYFLAVLRYIVMLCIPYIFSKIQIISQYSSKFLTLHNRIRIMYMRDFQYGARGVRTFKCELRKITENTISMYGWSFLFLIKGSI